MAFPTTPIIDDFNRADVSPLDGILLQGFQGTGDGEAEIVSNEIRFLNDNGTSLCAYRYSSTLTDCEAYIDIVAIVSQSLHSVLLRTANGGTNSCRGYEVFAVTDSQEIRIFRWDDNATATALGSFISQSVAAGDKIGASMVGNVLEIWYKSGAGAWTSLGTRTDATYASGQIGFRLGLTSGTHADNFGGGSISSNAYTLTADVGTFTLTGQNAGLLAGRKLTAGQASFTLTGQAATFARTRRLVAATGTFTLTGFSVAFTGLLTVPRSVVNVSRETRTIPVSEDSRVR